MTERLKIELLGTKVWRQCQHIQIYDVETLLAVTETGSFRQAAKKLGVDQSAITRRIQKLEEALGVSVFERSPTGARLTQAGWHFASRSRELGNQFLETVKSARSAGKKSQPESKIVYLRFEFPLSILSCVSLNSCRSFETVPS